ncbi:MULTISPECIES: hypothetical protein [unclassified Clostridium]|uniref:hypothetical protein n=1 Tax=unclassified Clostridium TaxID=2614128 RepID=UPI00215A6AC6|nr:MULTISPECIES: hypothetical protein [unclassified Clostridium]
MDMIDIGGYSLNVNCYGRGTPTVIFESGLGDDNGVWTLVQPEISKIKEHFLMVEQVSEIVIQVTCQEPA